MKDIKDIEKWYEEFADALVNGLYEAVDESVSKLKDKVVSKIELPEEARNVGQFEEYMKSIEKTRVKVGDDRFSGSVYSDLLVGGYDLKWKDVPVGAFLEWGTGPLGKSTNAYPHGYDYTLHVWDRHTWLQYLQTGTYGIRARPHFVPALNEMKPDFERAVQEAVEEAWKKSTN